MCQNGVLSPVQMNFSSLLVHNDFISGTVTPPGHEETLAPTPALSGGNDTNPLTTGVESDRRKNDLKNDLKMT